MITSKRLARLFGIKTEPEIREEISREPVVERAEQAMKVGELVLRELEIMEQRPKRKR